MSDGTDIDAKLRQEKRKSGKEHGCSSAWTPVSLNCLEKIVEFPAKAGEHYIMLCCGDKSRLTKAEARQGRTLAHRKS